MKCNTGIIAILFLNLSEVGGVLVRLLAYVTGGLNIFQGNAYLFREHCLDSGVRKTCLLLKIIFYPNWPKKSAHFFLKVNEVLLCISPAFSEKKSCAPMYFRLPLIPVAG